MLLARLRHPLAREIIAVLAMKVILLTLASIFLFDSSHRVKVDSTIAAEHFFDGGAY